VRGFRSSVYAVLDDLAGGTSEAEILEDFPARNLAPRWTRDLCDRPADAVPIRHLGSRAADDAPPEVIWVRLGDCATAQVEVVLTTRHPDLAAFDHDRNRARCVLERPGR
jgi:predicted nuclease of predicted toxin-antitoxin system